MGTVLDWKTLKAYRGAAAFWYAMKVEIGSKVMDTEFEKAIRDVKGLKSNFAPYIPMSAAMKKTARHHEIRKGVERAVAKQRPSTDATVSVGSQRKTATKTGKGELAVSVGHMWLHRVGKPLYARGYNTNWLILDATPYRVNIRNVVIYDCLAFDMERNEKPERIYVGQGKAGEAYGFCVAHSTNAAAQRAADWINQQTVTKLVGEEK